MISKLAFATRDQRKLTSMCTRHKKLHVTTEVITYAISSDGLNTFQCFVTNTSPNFCFINLFHSKPNQKIAKNTKTFEYVLRRFKALFTSTLALGVNTTRMNWHGSRVVDIIDLR